MGVHIGPGVLGLTLLQQHVGYNLVKLGDQLEHGVVGQMFQGKLALASVTWVSLPQDSVTVAGDHLKPQEKRDCVNPLPVLSNVTFAWHQRGGRSSLCLGVIALYFYLLIVLFELVTERSHLKEKKKNKNKQLMDKTYLGLKE